MIGIIDYGLGNIEAFKQAYKLINFETKYISGINDLKICTHIILPGVGSFDYAINRFKSIGIYDYLINKAKDNKIALLGVCVGMQMLFHSSEEGKEKGLNLIEGEVIKFKSDDSMLKTPHIGWNKIQVTNDKSILNSVNNNEFYFLHSYHCKSTTSYDCATTNYSGIEFNCAFQKNRICGVQFHPEKSHLSGLNVLKAFAEI